MRRVVLTLIAASWWAAAADAAQHEAHSTRSSTGLSARVNRSCTAASDEEMGALPTLAGRARHSRTIWIWWGQGWNDTNVPKLVHACAHSWAVRNPGFEVRRLSVYNLSSYAELADALRTYVALPATDHFAFSDILRTELLGIYGGLWVDATTFCLAPIATWIPASILDDGSPPFFGVRYPHNGEGEVASFLLYAHTPGSFIIQNMRHNLRRFWVRQHQISTYNVFDPDYFLWMQTFGCLAQQQGSRFQREYEELPSLPATFEDINVFAERQYCLHTWPLLPADRLAIERGAFFKLSHKAKQCKPAMGDAQKHRMRYAMAHSDGAARSVVDYFLLRDGLYTRSREEQRELGRRASSDLLQGSGAPACCQVEGSSYCNSPDFGAPLQRRSTAQIAAAAARLLERRDRLMSNQARGAAATTVQRYETAICNLAIAALEAEMRSPEAQARPSGGSAPMRKGGESSGSEREHKPVARQTPSASAVKCAAIRDLTRWLQAGCRGTFGIQNFDRTPLAL
jgi:hypothetical protein